MIKYVATRTKERLKFDTEGEISGSGNAEGMTRIRVLERGNRYETQETAVTSVEQVKKPDAH